ncbi:putative FBD-associated F-box protein [Cardamine amara subsp. amara]|uniref:FBD-associated F-box protein n=1 Tax=Cardamine amara subsp. amara TaxID=228776 RepID=A0ABD0ZMD6_CARAN
MPELEEADIYVEQNPEKLLVSITSVKRLTLHVSLNSDIDVIYISIYQLQVFSCILLLTYNTKSIVFSLYHAGIVFNQLQQLKLSISVNDWSKLLVRLLKDSPKLQILNLDSDNIQDFEEYESVSWDNEQSSVPQCLLKSLETFKFKGYKGRPEERGFLSYIFKHARHLKSPSILSR